MAGWFRRCSTSAWALPLSRRPPRRNGAARWSCQCRFATRRGVGRCTAPVAAHGWAGAGSPRRAGARASAAPRLGGLERWVGATVGEGHQVARRLERLVEFHDWQHNFMFRPVAALLLWELHCAFAVESWRARYGAAVPEWLRHVGEMTQLQSLGLDDTPVTDDSLLLLQKMSNLKVLWLDRTKVSGIGLARLTPFDKLEKLARGRVYTGSMAFKIGLVDKLGTLHDAIAHAKKLGGFKKGEKVEHLILPKPSSPFGSLLGGAGVRSETAKATALQQTLRSLSPELADQLRSLEFINLLAKEPALTLLPFRFTMK